MQTTVAAVAGTAAGNRLIRSMGLREYNRYSVIKMQYAVYFSGWTLLSHFSHLFSFFGAIKNHFSWGNCRATLPQID